MIHPTVPFALSSATYQYATEESESWVWLNLTWWFSTYPYSGFDYPRVNVDVRWRMPWTDADYEGNIRGARSQMFISGSRVSDGGMGADDSDFVRRGLPDEARSENEDDADSWGY